VSPFLKAHSSASALPVIPIFLAKLEIQSPTQLRISPPLPANPGKLRADPSVFSLNQLISGFSHLTGLIIGYLVPEGTWTQQINSITEFSTKRDKEELEVGCWNRTLFLWSHKCQMPNKKKVLQGKSF
jgi:hypothetical protein